ncbi:MAG: HNH endonuclease signature motif containing protein [Microbacteriaceae bacterium]
MELNQAVVRDFFSYDPEEGVLRWRKRRYGVTVGAVAGSMTNGARQLELGGRAYLAHRIIWLYMTGDWPKHMIDHINGVRDDNRWANLRDVSRVVNGQNMRKPPKSNKHGYFGVTPVRGKWRATITINGKNWHIGYYDTPEEAQQQYIETKRLFHEGCTI